MSGTRQLALCTPLYFHIYLVIMQFFVCALIAKQSFPLGR